MRCKGGKFLYEPRPVGRGEKLDFRLPTGELVRTAPGFVALTDATGWARFESLSLGWLRVSAEHAAHASASSFTTLEPDAPGRLTLVLKQGITITGRVLDEAGQPVAGARVTRSSSGREVESAADGSYRLGPVEPGKLVVLGPEGRRTEQRMGAAQGAVLLWDPVLPSQPAILGRVVDGEGAALVGWSVHANWDTWPGWRQGTTTDAEGRFAIYGAPEGALRVEVREEETSPLPLISRTGVRASEEEKRF